MIGYKPDLKSLGKRSALNAHAAFDEAGAGNTIRKIGAPVFDPACENARVKFPCVTRLYAILELRTNQLIGEINKIIFFI